MAAATSAAQALDNAEDEQFAAISETIVAIAQLRFGIAAPIRGDGGALDGIAVGLNLLAEELSTRVRDRERVDAVLDSLRDSVVVINDSGTISYLNQAARGLLGITDDSISGRLQQHLTLPESAREAGDDVLPLGNDVQPSIRRLLRRAGGRQTTPVIVTTAPLQGVGATGNGHVCVLSGRHIGAADQHWLAGSNETIVPFSVANLVEEVVAFHQASAKHLGLGLKVANLATLPPWVNGARSPLQSVLHSLMDAALQWTRSGDIELMVTSVESVATARVVLRFGIDNTGGQVDDSLRRRLFEDGETPESPGLETDPLSIKMAAVIAESLGGKLGLHRGPSGEFCARMWLELPTVRS